MDESGLDDGWLERCLACAAGARVTVFGDFCLDAYWLIDDGEAELSVETGLPVRRVRHQRYSLGGAGNVAANLAALGVSRVSAVGLIGDDLWGRQMLDLLADLHVDAGGMLCCQDDWQTLVYAKPCVGPAELNRIDFGGFSAISPSAVAALAEGLDEAAADSDAVILNQQVPAGVSRPAMIEAINEIIVRHPGVRFLVDSRHRAGLYRAAALKLNAHEAAALLGQAVGLDERIAADQAEQLARRLRERTGRDVFITRGADGLVVAADDAAHRIAGIEVLGPTDTVGAGDTVAAALAAALGGGAGALEAAALANVAASVTVRKLQTTGTATPDEIRRVGPRPDYIWCVDLADDPSRARWLGGEAGGIEVVRERPRRGPIRHALFDHDGTLSTLREGWQEVMEAMMVRAILPAGARGADDPLTARVTARVRDYIDATTGVQTLVQMRGLVEMVREFGQVPADAVRDMHGYKAVYERELGKRLVGRLDALRRGDKKAEDFQIAGAAAFLHRLHAAGVKLYLASGTDREDVAAEAEALGYADLFEGRIFGAVGDVHVEAKEIVIDKILRDCRIDPAELAAFGDGPVEIRLSRRRGATAVGVASDEVRRRGLNPRKRSRLIRAGADYVLADFTRPDALLDILLGEEESGK